MAIRKIANKERVDKARMDKIKGFVTKGYRYILLREPEPNGLDTYSSLIYFKNMTKDALLERLITSGEYNRLKQNSGQTNSEEMVSIESIKERLKNEEEEEERLEKEKLEEERLEKEKLEKEEVEKERLENEKLERERLEEEKLEEERLEEEKSEGERLKEAMLEASKIATEKKGKKGKDEKSEKKDIDSVRTIANIYEDKIVFVSTWGVNCGIALYTKDLLESLDKLKPGLFTVRNIDTVYSQKGKGKGTGLSSKLIELQHEFGIIPKPPEIGGKVIITWHTIPSDIEKTVKLFESKLNVVAHIVPCEGALEYLKPGVVTMKDVHVVSLGSRLMPLVRKEDARQLLDFDRLGIADKNIGFVFGFQSKNKNYQRLISAARNTGLYLIISGSIHKCGYNSNIVSNEGMTVIDRYLSDAEIDLYALASDILLFDYTIQDHYSSSSALHRIVGAGRPVITVDTNHFSDIDRNIALKFNYQRGLENCIVRALSDHDRLGQLALEYAKRTSREEMAKKRLKIYSKYVDIRGSVATAWEMLRV